MSSYLWRYFLENDADRFQRLLQGSQANAHTSGQRNASKPTGGLVHGSSPSSYKSPLAVSTKHRPGSPPANVVVTRQALKELDSMGRSILHLACTSPDGLPFVTALLSHPLTDPTVADLESGWTPLHRALYHGNMSTVREILSASPGNWNLVKIKDHAGDTPFEVFGASIYGIEKLLAREMYVEPEENTEAEGELGDVEKARKDAECIGDEVFTWGSNKNLTLGFYDGDDRSYPEKISLNRPRQLLLEQAKLKYAHLAENHGATAEELLDASTFFNPQNVVDIQLSKLHSAILTTDPHSNLFLCGFGRGGRLGFGDEQNTQFTFRPLCPPLLPKKKVERIALGLDHTVAVLSNGEVWTWGCNQWGQLGYVLQQKTATEEPIQSAPRQVLGLLKKEIVVGCAASRIHTAVFTVDSLFTFGKNDGQLGILDSSDARTLPSQSTPRKVAANFLTGVSILDVSALEKATAVLLENHEVWILAGYGYSKLTFSIDRPVGFPSGTKSITRYDRQPNFIRKITGAGDVLCALSRMGDVFTVDVNAALKERAERGTGKMSWTTQRAWSLRKRHMAVKDVAVGAEGSVLICTQSGGVWKRVKRAKAKEDSGDSGRYKFDRVAGLTRIVGVRSNSTGAFAAIRKDCNIMKTGLAVERQSLWDDMAMLLSFGALFEEEEGMEDIEIVPEDDEWGYGPKPRPKGYGKAVQWFMGNDVEKQLKAHLARLEVQGSPEDWDMAISTTKCKAMEIPVHKAMFSRSPVIRSLLLQGSGKLEGVCELVPAVPSGRMRLVLRGFDILTLLNLVYYIYVDTVIDLWHQRGSSKAQTARYKVLRTELGTIASTLGLKSLEEAVGRMHYPPRKMDDDFQAALNDPAFLNTADMIIDVADDEAIWVHSCVMRARCPFFEALYAGGASGRWLLGRRVESEAVHVDMKHIPKNVMDLVVSWLYSDWDTEGFNGIRIGVKEEEINQYLDFVLEVLSAANELMLDRLSQVCQKVIGSYINTRNAAGLLTVVAGCSEKMFKDRCLQYICLNLETMLENHLLDELDDDLMDELDQTVRTNQRRCFPNSRAGKQERLLEETYSSMREDSAREKAALVASYVVAEEELSLASSLKVQSTAMMSSSPSSMLTAPKNRRKSSKGISQTVAPSPSIKAANIPEDIFHMDGDDGEVLLPPSASSPLEVFTVPRKPDTVSKGKAPALASPAQASPSLPDMESSKATPPQAPPAPWTTPVKSSKLGMKEIMEQAAMAATGKSALTAQLTSSPSPKPEPGLGFKLSQKERKRREQQQQASSQSTVEKVFGPASGHTPEKEKKPAWNITPGVATVKVSLKEVLDNEGPAPTSLSQQPSASTSRSQSTPTKPRNIASASSSTPRTMPSPHLGPQPSPASKRPASSARIPSFSGPPAFKLGLDDIILQEQAQKQAIEDYKMKKSLEDIQAEQEFMIWWESESRRVQMAEKQAAASTEAASRGDRRGGGRGGGGGGGGRGRGRGRSRGGSGGGGRGRGRGRATGEGSQAVVKGV